MFYKYSRLAMLNVALDDFKFRTEKYSNLTENLTSARNLMQIVYRLSKPSANLNTLILI